MSKAAAPEIKKYMDKKVQVKLNGNRVVSGVLRGFDPFMNIVIDQAVEENSVEKQDMGMVVLRGNSIIMMEALERV
eukprot:m.19654 g.19654  ORF g.19654 m.19654 type:complete len:76 (-) comp12550_c1_seq1:690-917(-)